MCLAVPARVTRIVEGDEVIVDLGGIEKAISAALVDDVRVGDYLLVHVGFALGKIDAGDAEATLAMLALQAAARDELEAAG